jgi:hypothetical protein
MKNVYYLSYPNGMFGEFLCCQISKDANFYPNLNSKITHLKNKYEYRSVIDYNLIFLYENVPDYLSEHISSRFSEKHVLIRNHYYHENLNINLQRLVKVKLYCNEQWWLFSYILGIIKIASATMLSPALRHAMTFWEGKIYDHCKFPELTQYFLDNIEQITLFLRSHVLQVLNEYRLCFRQLAIFQPTITYVQPIQSFQILPVYNPAWPCLEPCGFHQDAP